MAIKYTDEHVTISGPDADHLRVRVEFDVYDDEAPGRLAEPRHDSVDLDIDPAAWPLAKETVNGWIEAAVSGKYSGAVDAKAAMNVEEK